MATTLDENSVFTLTNMRPVADEVITADWGQKIAENTAALYYSMTRIKPVREVSGVYYFWVIKPTGIDTLNVLVRGALAPSGTTTVTTKVFASGTSTSGTPDLTHADTFTATAHTEAVRTVDLSTLTDEVRYLVSVDTGDGDTSFVSLYF